MADIRTHAALGKVLGLLPAGAGANARGLGVHRLEMGERGGATTGRRKGQGEYLKSYHNVKEVEG